MSELMMPEGVHLFDQQVTLRWGDMDALGHINNIMYFRYFEHTRLCWFESLGNPPLATHDTGLVIVDNHAEYIKPLHYPTQITVRMGGHSPGRSSFISTYLIVDSETVYTRGSAKIVWIDTQKNKSTPLPDSVRTLLSV